MAVRDVGAEGGRPWWHLTSDVTLPPMSWGWLFDWHWSFPFPNPDPTDLWGSLFQQGFWQGAWDLNVASHLLSISEHRKMGSHLLSWHHVIWGWLESAWVPPTSKHSGLEVTESWVLQNGFWRRGPRATNRAGKEEFSSLYSSHPAKKTILQADTPLCL